MKNLTNIVGIDVGGSETRVSINGADFSFPTIIGLGEQREVYSEAHEAGYSEFIIHNNNSTTCVLKESALDMHKCEKIRLNHLRDKHKQDIYHINIIYSIIKLYYEYEIDPQTLKFIFTLPPREVFNNAPEYIRETLPGKYQIDLPYMKSMLNIEISPESIIGVLPEGAAARASLSKDKLPSLMGLTLVCDVGSRSTDSILLNNLRAIAATATSTDLGGHVLEADLLNTLRAAGVNTSTESLTEILKTGTIQGIDVAPLVKAVKKRFANSILNNIIETTSNIEGYTLQDIKTIFLVGRVFNQPDNRDISLLDMMQKLLPDKNIITPADQAFANSRGAYNVGATQR